MRVSLCFRTFIRSLARTVTGNLLVSLMRDLMSVVIQRLYKMSGVSSDPQHGERVRVRERSRKTWYNCSNSFPFRGDLKEELTPAHPISEVGELQFSPKFWYWSTISRQCSWGRAGPQRMCSKQLHSPSHRTNALWIKTQEEEVLSFLTAEAIRCTEVTCVPLHHTVCGRAQLSPVQFAATPHCSNI